MKKGSRSSNYSKRCVVLLADRLVIYDKVGDSMPIVIMGRTCYLQACINLFGCIIEQDEQIKRRFCIYSEVENREYFFEAILDLDFIEWFVAIQTNIDVNLHFLPHVQILGDQGFDFRSWDEDDYITPGMPITPETKRVIIPSHNNIAC